MIIATWQIYDHVYDMIYTLIKQKNIERLCECVKYHKVSPNKSSVMTYIREHEPSITQHYKVGVFYLLGKKGSSMSINAWSSVYMANHIDEIDNININEILKSFVSKLKEIFSSEIKVNKIYKLDEYDSVTNLVVWSDRDYTFNTVTYEDLYDYVVDVKTGLPKSKKSYHEMFTEDKKYRFFVDVEIPSELKDKVPFIKIDKLKTKI